MKTILLFSSSILLLSSCSNSSDRSSTDGLSDQEMKNRVEVEAIEFQIDSTEKITSQESKPEQYLGTAQQWEDMDRNPESNTEKPLVVLKKSLPKLPTIPFDDRNYRYINPDNDANVDAQYPGGIKALKTFISDNLIYPDVMGCYQGQVYVTFIVEKDGCLTHNKVMRGVSEEMDQAALNVIEAMPQWIPAKNNGKIVAARVRLPIRFSLN